MAENQLRWKKGDSVVIVGGKDVWTVAEDQDDDDILLINPAGIVIECDFARLNAAGDEHAGKILSPDHFFEGVKLSVVRKMKDLRMQFMADGKNLTDDQWAAITAHMMRAASEAAVVHLKLAAQNGIDMSEVVVLTEDDLARWIVDTGSGELEKIPYGNN